MQSVRCIKILFTEITAGVHCGRVTGHGGGGWRRRCAVSDRECKVPWWCYSVSLLCSLFKAGIWRPCYNKKLQDIIQCTLSSMWFLWSHERWPSLRSCGLCSLALADALADAPSLWTLGNAGMGALQVQFIFSHMYVYVSVWRSS